MLISQQYSLNFIIQYTVVGLIILMALGWIIWKTFKKGRTGTGSCCDCGLAQYCEKKKLTDNLEKSKAEKFKCHENDKNLE